MGKQDAFKYKISTMLTTLMITKMKNNQKRKIKKIVHQIKVQITLFQNLLKISKLEIKD